MAISKSNLKSRKICKLCFKLSPEEALGAKTVHVVGSFNEWSQDSHPMKKDKKGFFSLTLERPQGETLKFRYLLDNGQWINDPQADHYEFCSFSGVDNSVARL